MSKGSTTRTPCDGEKGLAREQDLDPTGALARKATAASSGNVRKCTIRRIHVEIHRVLGGEAASLREFDIAMSACLHGQGINIL